LIQSQGVAVYLTLSRQFTFAMRTGGGLTEKDFMEKAVFT